MSITIREKELKSGKKSLYLDIYHNGKRQYEFLQLYLTGDRQNDKEVRQLAESVKAKRQLEIQNNAHGFVPKFKRKANFVEYFRKYAKKFKDKGNDTYQSVLNYVIELGGEDLRFSDIDRHWVRNFKDLLEKNLKRSTARNYFGTLKAVLNKAIKDEIINDNPADRVQNFKKDEPQIQWLTTKEIKTLNETDIKEGDIKRAFLFACFTGLRYSDLKKLRWEEIQDGKIVFKQKKTSGSEYLPINKQAYNFLGELQDKGLIFELPRVDAAAYWVKKWGEKAELKKGLHFHMSRHTFAVMALNNGVDIFTLKKLLGHSNLNSTMAYAKVVNKTLDEAVNKIPDIEL